MDPFPGDLPAVAGYFDLTPLGAGGFGRVYRARGGDREVAIKLASPGDGLAAERLLRETEALAGVGPPHVPALLGTGRLDDGTPYLVLELVTAPTLAACVVAGERLDARAIGIAVCDALAATHQCGVIHRDLKPGNVFWDGTCARLVDFGLARPADAGRMLTRPGELLGTPEYMAPEQCAGRTVDARADVYAVGIILYELVAGRPPFVGSAAEVQHAQRHRRPPRPSLAAPVTPALEAV